MDEQHSDALDTLIDSALSGEPVRRAPFDLAQRVDERVHAFALVRRGRQRFVQQLSGFVATAAALVTAGFFLLRMTDLAASLLDGVPGMLGYADYLRATVMPEPADSPLLLLAGVATLGLAVVAGLGALAATMDRRLGVKASQQASA